MLQIKKLTTKSIFKITPQHGYKHKWPHIWVVLTNFKPCLSFVLPNDKIFLTSDICTFLYLSFTKYENANPKGVNSWMLGGIITVAAGVVCGKKKKKWESIDGCGHFLSFATLFLTKLLQQVARRKTGGMGKKGKKQTAATRSFFFVPVYQRSILSF